MVVSPRYAEYEDTIDTGTSVPVLLPASQSSHSLSADSLPPGDSSSSLTASQGDAGYSPKPGRESGVSLSEVLPPREESRAPPQVDSPEPKDAEQQQHRQESAQYYLCQRSGVDHVFVDHPLYCRTSDIYGSSNVNTYQEAGDFPDLDLRYSILCQAALAAPLLLWENSAHAQPQHWQAEKPVLGEGGDATEQGSAVGMAGVKACGRPEAAVLGTPQSDSRLPDALHPEPAADETSVFISPPSNAVGSTSAPHHRGGPEACQQADPEHVADPSRLQGSRSGAEHGQDAQAGGDRAPTVFVSNDWPCAPLALRLKHTLQSAQAPAGRSSGLPGGADREGQADVCSSSGQLPCLHAFVSLPSSDRTGIFLWQDTTCCTAAMQALPIQHE